MGMSETCVFVGGGSHLDDLEELFRPVHAPDVKLMKQLNWFCPSVFSEKL